MSVWVATLINVVIALAFLLVCLWSECARRRFNRKWPPISDDEFMARLPAGTSRSVALRVRHIVADQCGIPVEQIHPDATIIELFD